ncbi:MAG TPA: hypothetical protein VFW33_22860 [Gemmataceae bacterium]|nr:hypothetical protein [Gemmataceae bacterium]
MTLALNRARPAAPLAFTGLLRGLRPGPVLTWGGLEALSLFPADPADRPQFVPPLSHLKLAGVRTYGKLELHSTAERGLLVAPMHVGFFQEGAQNHATSRTLVLDAGERLVVDDCFCIQQAQGGLLKAAQQRFVMLPLGLRRTALERRGTVGFSRLWADIDTFTRQYGVARGGHLERFLRPYFARLQPYRHGLEALPGQVGAAYFVAGRLVGVEVAPNPAYWQDLCPILAIYGYAPAAVLALDRGLTAGREPLSLDGVEDVDDLADRLAAARGRQQERRADALRREVDPLAKAWADDEVRHGLRVQTLLGEPWAGQQVRERGELVYLSLFASEFARTSEESGASK